MITATTTAPPIWLPAVALGPVQQQLLILLLIAMLRRLGILPAPSDDQQDVRFLLSSATVDNALTQIRDDISSRCPWNLATFDQYRQAIADGRSQILFS